jgi:HSP20 family protein
LGCFLDDNFWGFKGLPTRNNHVPVNIRETEKTFELEVVAPGQRKEDFAVQLSNDHLTVSFEHNMENRQKNIQEQYVSSEYRMQSFSRSFHINDTIDADQISARYENGILHISLPKKGGDQKQTKAIEVK